jgi:hypothetical protein
MAKRINESGFVEDFSGEIEADLTFQGYFETTYKDLKRIFGQPTEGDGFKVDAQWLVMTPAGPASIYNYKDGKNYLGREGTATTKLTDWHIGGMNKNTYAWAAFAIFSN